MSPASHRSVSDVLLHSRSIVLLTHLQTIAEPVVTGFAMVDEWVKQLLLGAVLGCDLTQVISQPIFDVTRLMEALR